MSPARILRRTATLILFALLQVVVPTVAAIADAWRQDRMTPYAHVESETGSGCALVHGDDCRLCVATETHTGPVRCAGNGDTVPTVLAGVSAPGVQVPVVATRTAVSPRAPPTV